ncbi:MAG: NEL-type E3 ubiquitin ligase domain-containing protein [Candidatus Rhabdochlamydia sp.]
MIDSSNEIQVGGDFHFYNCRHFTLLPKGLKVGGSLSLSGCEALTHLPEDLEIKGVLNLFDCNDLIALPNSFKVGGSLHLSRCKALKQLPEDLEVEKNLKISNCKRLITLPKGLKVGGFLDLSRCKAITHLPENLEIKGDLDLSNCKALTTLPKDLKVGGSLHISRCEALKQLPEDCEIKGNFKLSNCNALMALPKGFKVEGSFHLLDCEALTYFSEDVEIKENFTLSDCKALTVLSKGLKVGGSFELSDCKALTVLSKGLKVGGSLHISRCESLTHLPEDLEVEGNFIAHYQALTALPKNLKVGGFLDLSRCDALTYIPEDIDVKGHFYLSSCKRLTALPKGLKVGSHICLSDCESLTHLPDDLEVKGNLEIHTCESLTLLPKGLKVKNNLNLYDCTALTAIPYPFNLGGNLDLIGCRLLTSLPDWIVTLGPRSDGEVRVINLTYTGLSPTVLMRLEESVRNVEGIQFHFSQEAAETYVIEFETLLPALAFWEEEAQLSLDCENICQKLDQQLSPVQDHTNLLQFLIRLTAVADYYNVATRIPLARRVVQMIWLMVEDPQICAQFAYLIHQGLASCDDRVMATLDTLGFYHKLHQLKHPSTTCEELKQVGKSFFLLEALNKKIELYIQKLQFVDEVEVYMAFHTQLKCRLNLPIETEGMLFRRCVALSDEEIDQVGNLVLEEVTEATFESFLLSWDPWQRYQRKSLVVKWEELPVADRALTSEDICPYLQDTPSHPVLYKGVIYDYDTFVQRYIEEGVDWVREKVQFHELFRLNPFMDS